MISMKKIADAAGVSRTTVSFVLNGRYERDMKISPEIVRRVKDIAAEMGYVRNELVQSVVTGKSKVIAIVAEFFDFMMPMIRGYSETAAKHGYSITLIPRNSHDSLTEALMVAVKYRVAGVLLPGLTDAEKAAVSPRIGKYGIPISGITCPPLMYFDQIRSAEIAADYLISLNHRRIFCLTQPNPITDQRVAGYENSMRRKGLATRIFEEESMEELIAEKPDAVFCVTDSLGMRLLQCVNRKHLFVPDVFSVVGFGNILSDFFAPSLTTISEPYYLTACADIENLLSIIEKGKPLEGFQPFVGELIIRDSTKHKTESEDKK